MSFSVQHIYNAIFKIWRVKRFRLFVEKIQPLKSDRMIDVGGYPDFWKTKPVVVASIDCFNLQTLPWDWENYPDHHISTLIGDGRALPVADQAYDIVFSNSVVEHVGSWEDQVAFAKEARRVGNSLWIQTPAYECPIEPHYVAPFIHWLPKSLQGRLLRHFTPWGILSKPSQEDINFMLDTTRLLKKREMQFLFPDCEIHTEKMLGVIPKSYIAIRRKDASRIQDPCPS